MCGWFAVRDGTTNRNGIFTSNAAIKHASSDLTPGRYEAKSVAHIHSMSGTCHWKSCVFLFMDFRRSRNIKSTPSRRRTLYVVWHVLHDNPLISDFQNVAPPQFLARKGQLYSLFFFFLFFHPIYYLPTTLALPPGSSSDPGSRSGPSPLLPTTRYLPSFFIARRTHHVLLASNCAYGI